MLADGFLQSGLFVYTALNGMIWAVMALSRGALEPKDYQHREYWTWKPAGEKPWIVRIFSKGKFWEDERKRRRRSGQESIKEHDEFTISEVDGDSIRSSHIATSFAPSTHRASEVALAVQQREEMGRGLESHEMGVVMPQQVVVTPNK